MAGFTLETFENFLEGVDLKGYRERFTKIKTVEMDLKENIQALTTIYEQYWDNVDKLKRPRDFDSYYEIYWKRHEKEILEFWKESGFGLDCDCFPRGLKARIYRTWTSLITQIHGGYAAETVFGKGSVKMSAELDRKNVDILIVNPDGSDKLKIQIKKKTLRPEIARMQKETDSDEVAYLYYNVPSPKDYENPYYLKNGTGYKVGQEKPFAREFVKWHPETGTLDRLENGFVIFTRRAFLDLQ